MFSLFNYLYINILHYVSHCMNVILTEKVDSIFLLSTQVKHSEPGAKALSPFLVQCPAALMAQIQEAWLKNRQTK